jgi:4-aminobutyrate aminotransferase-like enzyme
MLGRGVPLIVVSRQLGHANPHITAAVYAHLVNEEQQLDAAAAAFDAHTSADTLRETLRENHADAGSRMATGIDAEGQQVS